MQTEVIKQQLDTCPPIRSVENSMKYQMPEPADTGTVTNYYSYATVQAAFDAGRAAGLEAAAKVCEVAVHHTDMHSRTFTKDSYQACADAIRNLSKEQT